MSNETEDVASNNQENINVADINDGPQPMTDRKPCKTTPNSADQFWQSHQAEYEARGKPSVDLVDQVNNHNTAYPLLKDELDKRRSTTRVTTGVNANRLKFIDYVCSRCRKLRRNLKESELRERDKSLIRNRQHKTKDRVIRRKPNRSHKPIQNEKPQIIKEIGKTRDNRNINKRNAGAVKTDVSVNKKESASEAGFIKKPSSNYTDETSMSSRHSFSSMEHEPMVS